MIQVSRMADYAVVLTSVVAKNTTALHTAPSVAEATNLGEATVSKLLKALAKNGILTSTRGAKGGYSIARDPKNINVAEVVQAVDGPISMTWCLQENCAKSKDCIAEKACTAKPHWMKINTAIVSALEGITIADINNS